MLNLALLCKAFMGQAVYKENFVRNFNINTSNNQKSDYRNIRYSMQDDSLYIYD